MSKNIQRSSNPPIKFFSQKNRISQSSHNTRQFQRVFEKETVASMRESTPSFFANQNVLNAQSYEWSMGPQFEIHEKINGESKPLDSQALAIDENISLKTAHFSHNVKLAFESLQRGSKLLSQEGITLPAMDEIWQGVFKKNHSEHFVKFLHEKYQEKIISAESAYFLYAQQRAYGSDQKIRLISSTEGQAIKKNLPTNEIQKTWNEDIQGLGDMISFLGILGNMHRGFKAWPNKVPSWFLKPEIALVSFEQKYRQALNEMHFMARWPLEKIWSPMEFSSEGSSKNFLQKLLPNRNVSTYQSALNRWSDVAIVKRIQSYGAATSFALSTAGAAWGLVCSSISGKIGAMGEQHGEQLFEWGHGIYLKWTSPSIQNVQESPHSIEKLGERHVQQMIKNFSTSSQ